MREMQSFLEIISLKSAGGMAGVAVLYIESLSWMNKRLFESRSVLIQSDAPRVVVGKCGQRSSRDSLAMPCKMILIREHPVWSVLFTC